MEDYYNSNNLKTVFNNVNDVVFQNTNIKIKDHKKARQQFQKMAHIVANKFMTDGITLVELNDKLNLNAVSFFTNYVNNKKRNNPSSSSSTNLVDNTLSDNYDYMPIPVVTNVNSINNTSSNTDNSFDKPVSSSDIAYKVSNEIPEIIGNDLPLFSNIDSVINNEEINIDDKVNDYLNTRNNLMEEPPSMRPMYEKNIDPSNILNHKNAELVSSENTLRNNLSSGEVSMYEELNNKMNDNFSRITKRMEELLIKPSLTEEVFSKILSSTGNMQPKYMTRSNYIIVNSGDRDWLNETISNHNRYNFNVKFGKHDNSASINNVYKNITSIELVNCFMPKDNVLLPFDTRPYIDILTYPYLVLKIPELTNVFRGTNNSTDNAFSILIYDKKHDSQVLSNDFISGGSSIVNGAPSSQFYSEYNKSYYKYIPAYFEKKVYDNQPLASLSHMSINIVNPNNENINALSDVLEISEIAFTADLSGLTTTDFEYDITNGYPYDTSATTREYLRIKTSNPFSSKLFRLGDNIKISGLTSSTGASDDEITLVDYLNSSSGHYIYNLDVTDYTSTGNQGFTSNIYIAPPGSLSDDTTLDTTTYIDSGSADTSNITIGSSRLINTNLQTHFLFKINTREGDFTAVNNAMNI